MDFKLILYAQYPALLLLSILCLVRYLRVRKRSSVRSILSAIAFSLLLASSVVFCAFGAREKYWTLRTLVPFGGWSWVGIVIVFVLMIAALVHRIEVGMNRRRLQKAVAQAEQNKAAEIERAREEGAAAERAKAAAQTSLNAADSAQSGSDITV